jgi:hypothetical protein
VLQPSSLKENLVPRLKGVKKNNWGWAVTTIEGSRGSWLVENPHVPRGFIFGVLIPLDLIEPSSPVTGDSVLLVKNLDRICLVR